MNHPDPTDIAAEAPAAGRPTDHPAEVVPSSTIKGPTDHHRVQLWKFTQRRAPWLNECKELYGKRFRLRLRPGLEFVILSDPDDVRAVYLGPRTSLHCGNSNGALAKYFGGTGIAFLDEEEHRERRRVMTRSVKGTAFKRITESVQEQTARAVAEWPRDEVVVMHPLVHRWAMNVIREVVFGKVIPACWPELLDELLALVEFARYRTSMLLIDQWSPRKKRIMGLLPGTGVKDFWYHRERVDALLAKAIAERVELGELGDDMLSVLLGVTRADGSMLSVRELRDEIMTMFVAGTVTTVSAVCWSLEYLSRDSEVRTRLRTEIDAGVSEEYLTATAHEALRINPPLPNNLARQVVEPIEINGVRYVPGDLLVPSAELMNNDPVRYPEPDKFRPERWLGVQPNQYSWIPFGGGHTRCLGDRIAIHEIKCMLREVLSTCDIERMDRDPSKAIPRGPVMVPKGGPRMKLRARSAVRESVGS